MRWPGSLLAIGCCLIGLGTISAQSPLPLVDGADFGKVKANCERLLKTLEDLKSPLPAETVKPLRELLEPGGKDDEAVLKIQRLLDPHCLVGVTINPESRVKAARGLASAELQRDGVVYRLAKVQNDAGVTQALTLTSPHQVGSKESQKKDQWLDAAVYAKAPMTPKLSGHELEYVILRLGTKETGKREAKLIFDVGQGTQDLGFRAEVPILFTMK
jgi:hypothetical protein